MAIYTLFPWKDKLGNANLQPKKATRLSNCYSSASKDLKNSQAKSIVCVLQK